VGGGDASGGGDRRPARPVGSELAAAAAPVAFGGVMRLRPRRKASCCQEIYAWKGTATCGAPCVFPCHFFLVKLREARSGSLVLGAAHLRPAPSNRSEASGSGQHVTVAETRGRSGPMIGPVSSIPSAN
jgi:hypothetical protein